MLLGGCATSAEPPPPPAAELPPVPADISACLRMDGVDIPDRALTAGDVEKLWGGDRRILAVLRRCGLRLEAWYVDLWEHWR